MGGTAEELQAASVRRKAARRCTMPTISTTSLTNLNSPTPSTTGCCGTVGPGNPTPRTRHRRLAHPAGRGRPPRVLRVAHPPPAQLSATPSNDEELREFDEKVKRHLGLDAEAQVEYVAELKIDSLAISLTYEHRVFQTGATRGMASSARNVQQPANGRFRAAASARG